MKAKLTLAAAACALLWAMPASAQTIRVVTSCPIGVSPAYDTNTTAARLTIDVNGKLCTADVGLGTFPTGATAISGNAAGTTGAVVGTLAAAASKTTYICGFNVQAIGGTAAVGPITIAGLIGSSQVYQGSSSAAGGTVASGTFSPCIPASAANTAITITTTANGTATAVDVNSWGFQQ